MMNKVIENMLGNSLEQRFEEIQVEEVRAKRQAEIDAQMKDKGKSAEGKRSCSDEVDDSEEDEDEEKLDDPDDVFSTSSHDDDNDDDDNQGGTGIKVTEPLNEKNIDDYMNDGANEVSEGAVGEGEHVDDQNVDQVEKLILRLEPHVEEEELNAFDINHQAEYEYKYVEDADVYDRVEVEDCTDEESMNEDTSQFPTLMEFFTQENRDELRRKVDEILKDKNFDSTPKDL
ncbi:hypothetical protein Hanom_Chr11g01011291 [Helianthus anomalus]